MKTRFRIFRAIWVWIAILTGTPAFSQYSLEFNGDTDYVALGGPDLPPPWTLEVMVYKLESDNYQHLLTSADGNSGIRLEQWWGTKVGFTRSGVMDWDFGYSVPSGQWVPMAITNNGTVTRLYVNGVLTGTVNASIDLPRKWISRNTTDASLKARIDELRIWNTVLSDAVIQQYAGQPVTSSHPDYNNLLHYYKFDEGSGNLCYDSKGTLNGTIYGAVYYIQTDVDAGIVKLIAPENSPDNYSPAEPLILKIKNFGVLPVAQDFTVSYTLNGVTGETVTIPASTSPLQPNQALDVAFSPVDMNTAGTYSFVFHTSLPGDQNHNNDTLAKELVSVSEVLGNITGFRVDTCTALITCGAHKVRVVFYKDDLFRIWLGPNGVFNNPAGDRIVVSYASSLSSVNWSDEGDYYRMSTGKIVLRAYKTPCRFALYEADNQKLVWQESGGLDFGTRSFQYLAAQPDEYFYGGGMQNGYFSHKGKVIKISNETENWDDGAVPNPVPFYMSTKGYGAFRNTFAPGVYDFNENAGFSHQENRFDCFYFYGPSLKEILNVYTALTGRAPLIPRWGLEFGDADCYNKNGQTTPEVLTLVADKYRENDLPGGWILPNDGYGCGYTDLPGVVAGLHNRGFYTGLWTENGVSQIAWEVGTAGTRACKLDVAWVGSGYQYALDACRSAYEGVENNCDGRGFVWSVCGWAGTQRYSVVWSGDQYGGFEYVRFHIPTFIGSGLSGFNYASSDLDGIFEGSGSSYARDMQWKTFIPTTYAMSGWASVGKHPWNYGTNITNINRKYLKLKMRLKPYLYTYCNEAYETGTPVVRAMVLEYPDDTVTRGTITRYQFMSGEWFLVAPVYKPVFHRDSIYFPAGKWIDYWDGTVYEGPMFLDNYPADLSKLPVFVKAGAIVPQYPEMLYDSQLPCDPVTFDIYPHGTSHFNLYEDDGISRNHRNGESAVTLITSDGPVFGTPGNITVTVGESVGEYVGKPASRSYLFEIHYGSKPTRVKLNNTVLTEYESLEALGQASDGWFYDQEEKHGLVHVKLQPQSLSQSFQVKLEDDGVPVPESKPGRKVRVYPNPSQGNIRIQSDEKIVQINVYDAAGKLVNDTMTIGLDGCQAEISYLASKPGLYYLEIRTPDGQMSRKIHLM